MKLAYRTTRHITHNGMEHPKGVTIMLEPWEAKRFADGQVEAIAEVSPVAQLDVSGAEYDAKLAPALGEIHTAVSASKRNRA